MTPDRSLGAHNSILFKPTFVGLENPSLFHFRVKCFCFCLAFILLQEGGEGKQTTLTCVCRANLAVRGTLTVFNLACNKIFASKEEEEENSIHDSSATALLHTCIALFTSEEEECYLSILYIFESI